MYVNKSKKVRLFGRESAGMYVLATDRVLSNNAISSKYWIIADHRFILHREAGLKQLTASSFLVIVEYHKTK